MLGDDLVYSEVPVLKQMIDVRGVWRKRRRSADRAQGADP